MLIVDNLEEVPSWSVQLIESLTLVGAMLMRGELAGSEQGVRLGRVGCHQSVGERRNNTFFVTK